MTVGSPDDARVTPVPYFKEASVSAGDKQAGLDRMVGKPQDVTAAFVQFPLMLFATEGPEMTIVAVNDAVRAASGFPEPVGMRLRDFASGMAGQEAVEPFSRSYASGETIVRSQWRIRNEPGNPDSEIFVDIVITPWRHPDGTLRGNLGYGFDVTREVLARQASERRAAGAAERLALTPEIVLTLQRSLLPETVPVLPRVRLAARYVVAAAELQAGGDWFDALPTGNGRVALVVGDVAGQGAAAAAAMAQLRTVLHEALLSGTPVTEAIDRLDRFAAATPAARAATVCVAELDPAAGTLTWSIRAHPPPLVCSPGGATRFLRDGQGSALGIGGGHASLATAKIAPDEVVFLYCDGLVERPGETIDRGLDRLARIVGTAASEPSTALTTSLPDRISDLAVERIVGAECTDDVIVLAAHLLPDALAPLILSTTAEPEQLSGLREAVNTWVTELGADHDDRLALCLAAYEAAANVVDHAYYGRSPGELRLAGQLGDDGAVTLVIADDGRWRPPNSMPGGRGLTLIRACTDLKLDQCDDGTTATMRRQLTHPAVVGSARPAPDGKPRTEPFSAVVTRHDPTVITARGTVDAGTVGLLSTEIAKHGAAPLVIDLALVTFLASAGVQLLHDLITQHDVRLHAPAGTPAHEVLNLVGLSDLLIT